MRDVDELLDDVYMSQERMTRDDLHRRAVAGNLPAEVIVALDALPEGEYAQDEVSEALLAITDERGRNSSRPTIVKAYNTVRGSAVKQVKAALPRVGALVQKYA